MNNQHSRLRPFLTRYEVEIPQTPPAGHIYYDETQMILMAGGEPAAAAPPPDLPGGTSHTRVGQETTDDD